MGKSAGASDLLMPVMPLYIYDEAFESIAGVDERQRREIAYHFERVVLDVGSLRKNIGGFSIVSIGGIGQLFLQQVKGLVKREFYSLMITKIKSVYDARACEEIEVSYDGSASMSLTACTVMNSIILSIATAEFSSPTISCISCYFEGDDEEHLLNNLAFDRHVGEHKDFIETWGLRISDSYRIFETPDFYVIMYPGPKEHYPPHVHVFLTDGVEFAKYNIEDAKLTKGAPDFGREITKFIRENRETLLASWERSQRGQNPFRIVATAS